MFFVHGMSLLFAYVANNADINVIGSLLLTVFWMCKLPFVMGFHCLERKTPAVFIWSWRFILPTSLFSTFHLFQHTIRPFARTCNAHSHKCSQGVNNAHTGIRDGQSSQCHSRSQCPIVLTVQVVQISKRMTTLLGDTHSLCKEQGKLLNSCGDVG